MRERESARVVSKFKAQKLIPHNIFLHGMLRSLNDAICFSAMAVADSVVELYEYLVSNADRHKIENNEQRVGEVKCDFRRKMKIELAARRNEHRIKGSAFIVFRFISTTVFRLRHVPQTQSRKKGGNNGSSMRKVKSRFRSESNNNNETAESHFDYESRRNLAYGPSPWHPETI